MDEAGARDRSLLRRRVDVKKPSARRGFHRRKSFNYKRRLTLNPDEEALIRRAAALRYQGSPKHKRTPAAFGLEPYRSGRSDRTMCDRDAGFRPRDMATITALLQRGARAGLVDDDHRYWWSVADTGWIFEVIDTSGMCHGYPLLPGDPMIERIIERFAVWAERDGTADDRRAAENAGNLYGVRR